MVGEKQYYCIPTKLFLCNTGARASCVWFGQKGSNKSPGAAVPKSSFRNSQNLPLFSLQFQSHPCERVCLTLALRDQIVHR